MKNNSIFKTAAFIGHRPDRLPWGVDECSVEATAFKRHLKETLTELIVTGCINFLSGAARGFDTLAAETVIELREEYPWVSLTLVLPCDNQADRWSDSDRARWERLITNADHVLHMASRFDKGCLFRRNRYLVDHSGVLIAGYDGDPNSGTGMTLAYAAENARAVIRIPLSCSAIKDDILGREAACRIAC